MLPLWMPGVALVVRVAVFATLASTTVPHPVDALGRRLMRRGVSRPTVRGAAIRLAASVSLAAIAVRDRKPWSEPSWCQELTGRELMVVLGLHGSRHRGRATFLTHPRTPWGAERVSGPLGQDVLAAMAALWGYGCGGGAAATCPRRPYPRWLSRFRWLA
jgi:hypothetical protein